MIRTKKVQISEEGCKDLRFVAILDGRGYCGLGSLAKCKYRAEKAGTDGLPGLYRCLKLEELRKKSKNRTKKREC